MNRMTSQTASSRLTRALRKAERLTSVTIEVYLTPKSSHAELVRGLDELGRSGIAGSRQALIGVDPVRRHVALALSADLGDTLPSSEIRSWLGSLQEDLHMTHPENAISLGILSLAIALSAHHPVLPTSDGKPGALA